MLRIVTVFLTRRAVFSGGAALREEEEEYVRSRPEGDVTESLRQIEQVAGKTKGAEESGGYLLFRNSSLNDSKTLSLLIQ